MKLPAPTAKKPHSTKLQVGFVPLVDCAPLIVAQEFGFFGKYDLHVSLRRELGWATIRDKIIYHELDAAHALAAMPLAATLGLGSIPCDCLCAIILSFNGNGITISADLYQTCFKAKIPLRDEIQRLRRKKVFTFGVVAPFSSHRHLLRKWLSSQGVDPDHDVRIVTVPPPQMVANLKAGNLDGFCSGEPWNASAHHARAGVLVATSADLEPHPEKVLMVQRGFAEKRTEEHTRLVAALIEACEWCANPHNHEELIAVLARREYVGVPASQLRHGVTELCNFPTQVQAEPSDNHAAWLLTLMRSSGLCPQPEKLTMPLARRVFHADLFEQAAHLVSTKLPTHEYETV